MVQLKVQSLKICIILNSLIWNLLSRPNSLEVTVWVTVCLSIDQIGVSQRNDPTGHFFSLMKSNTGKSVTLNRDQTADLKGLNLELDLKTGINQAENIKQTDIWLYDYKIVVTQFPITPDFVVTL